MKFNTLCAAILCGLALSGMTYAHDHHEGHDDHDHDTQAIGAPGDAHKAARTVNVVMTDAMRFVPDHVMARQGETIRFVIQNTGQVKHEFVLGTEAALKAHYELMKKFPEMEHNDPNMVTVAPGQSGEVVWRFTKTGKIDFACLQPGHYDAGMKGAVMVAGKRGMKHDPKVMEGHADHQH
ncbi:MAG: cupredoxin family protein [Burkholderiaceae bacterium]|nr:cupredoxin family protein [Burkholderiaceae bacterium]